MIRRIYNYISKFFKKKLIKNMANVAIIIIFIKLISFYKETLVSSNYGLSEQLDTFYIAVLIPVFIQGVTTKALKNLFVPNYIIEKNTTKNIGSFMSFTTIGILLLCAVLIIGIILFDLFLLEIVFEGHDYQYYSKIRQQLHILLFCLPLWTLSSLLGGLLEIEGRFFESTIMGFFTPIITIVNIIFFKDFFGITLLVWSMLIGSSCRFLGLLTINLRNKYLILKRPVYNENIKTMLREYPPKIISGFLTASNKFIDQLFAAQLVVGAISSINYGIRLPALIIGVSMPTVGNVLLPYFSRKLHGENSNQGYEKFIKILVPIFLVSSIFSLLLLLLSEDIIRILFERGKFTTQDTQVVGMIMKIAMIYVPFRICTMIIVKFLTAANKNRPLAWISLFNVVSNVGLNFLLVPYYGVYGLVFSTVITLIGSFIIHLLYTRKVFKNQKTIRT